MKRKHRRQSKTATELLFPHGFPPADPPRRQDSRASEPKPKKQAGKP